MPRPVKSLSTLTETSTWFDSVATKMGLSGSNVVTITAEQYDKVSKGSDYFPRTCLFRTHRPTKLTSITAARRHLISVPIATAMDITPAQLTTITASQFNEIPQGSDYFPRAFTSRTRRPARSRSTVGARTYDIPAVATVMGLNPSQVVSITASQYDAIPQGSAYYPQGIFVENNETGEIDQVDGGQRYWVPSQTQLEIGLTPSEVATIGVYQFNAIPWPGRTRRQRDHKLIVAQPRVAGYSSSERSSFKLRIDKFQRRLCIQGAVVRFHQVRFGRETVAR